MKSVKLPLHLCSIWNWSFWLKSKSSRNFFSLNFSQRKSSTKLSAFFRLTTWKSFLQTALHTKCLRLSFLLNKHTLDRELHFSDCAVYEMKKMENIRDIIRDVEAERNEKLCKSLSETFQ